MLNGPDRQQQLRRGGDVASHRTSEVSLLQSVRELRGELIRLAGSDPAPIVAWDAAAGRRRVGAVLDEVSAVARAGRLGRDVHRLRRRRDLIGADLHGLDLRAADLRGVLLLGADLRGADLTDADLLGADLRAADLRGARIEQALFTTGRQLAAYT